MASSFIRIEERVASCAGSKIEPLHSPLAPPPLSGEGCSVLNPKSSILHPRFSRGFTLLELVIVIAIIVVLMGAFLERVMYYQEQAEKTAMEQVAGALQSALTMQVGQLMTRGQQAELAALARANPMNWLQKKPDNYRGEFYDPAPQAVESGNWMFDMKSRELVYAVRNANNFKPGADGKLWIRFHVVVEYERPPAPGARKDAGALSGALIQPVQSYVWF